MFICADGREPASWCSQTESPRRSRRHHGPQPPFIQPSRSGPPAAPTASRWRAWPQLDSKRPLTGEVLVAERDGELAAALSLDDGRPRRRPVPPDRRARRAAAAARRRARARRRGRRAPVGPLAADAAAAHRVRHSPSSSASPAAAGVPQTPAAVTRVRRPPLHGSCGWRSASSTSSGARPTSAIRVVVETMPPMLGAAARFLLGGRAAARVPRRPRAASPPCARRARQLRSAALVGTLLMGANAVISVAELHVPSGLAALIVASVPLWVILLRRCRGDRPAPRPWSPSRSASPASRCCCARASRAAMRPCSAC